MSGKGAKAKQPCEARAWAPIPHKDPKTKKPTGRWKARWRDVDGTPRQAGIFDTLAEAWDANLTAVKEANERAGTSGHPPTSPSSSRPGDQNLRHHIDNPPRPGRFARGTQDTHKDRRRRVLNHLDTKTAAGPIRDITATHLLDAQASMLAAHLAQKTINDAFKALSKLLRDLMVEDKSIVDVAADIKVTKFDHRLDPGDKREYRVVTPAEFHCFMNDYVPEQFKGIFAAPAMTGARLAEYLAFDVNRIDWGLQMIQVTRTVSDNGGLEDGNKTTRHPRQQEQTQIMLLFPRALAQLFASRPPLPNGLMIYTAQHNSFGHRNFYRDMWGDPAKTVKRDLPMTRWERDGNRRFTPEDLRHSFANWLESAGLPLHAIDRLMAHTTLRAKTEDGRVVRDPVLLRHYLHDEREWARTDGHTYVERASLVLTAVLEQGKLMRLHEVGNDREGVEVQPVVWAAPALPDATPVSGPTAPSKVTPIDSRRKSARPDAAGAADAERHRRRKGITEDARWQMSMEVAEAFFEREGHLEIRRNGTVLTADGGDVGHWMHNQKSAYRAGRLRPERLAALRGLIPEWPQRPVEESANRQSDLG